LFEEYGADYWGFSTKPKEAFGANGRLESTLEALAAIGYLERLPHGFVWTSLATTAMRCTYNWPLPDPQPQMARKPMPTSPIIEIIYCRLCGWGLRASWMAQELLTTFAEEIGSVTLTPDASGGVFEVRVEGDLIWSRKDEKRFPEITELNQRVGWVEPKAKPLISRKPKQPSSEPRTRRFTEPARSAPAASCPNTNLDNLQRGRPQAAARR
jgi:selenoprotein W-related protein